MSNPQHIIIGGTHKDEHWVDTIDPNNLKFNKSLAQGEWEFFGRMFIGNTEYCTVQYANLKTETQDINLDFSKSSCATSPISSTGINSARFYFCEDIQRSTAEECISQAGDTKSFQFDFYKTGSVGLTGSPYFTSECYTIQNGQALIETPFYLQTSEDISLPGKIKMYKGVNCNGLSSEISFDYFLSDNEKIRSNTVENTLEYFIYDPTKNKKNIPSNKIAEVEVEIISEYLYAVEIEENTPEEQELELELELETEEEIADDSTFENEGEVVEEEQEGENETASVEETVEESEETTFKVEINLLSSELTISESSDRHGRGKQTVQYSHAFNMEVELFKVVINKIDGANDSSSKVSLPDLTSDHLFSFDENDQIEVYLGDYIQSGETFVEFNVHVIGPKSKSEKLNFEFYQLEN